MLGIEDKYVLAACLLCIASTVLCAAYAVLARNRGEDAVRREDPKWAAEEIRIERES